MKLKPAKLAPAIIAACVILLVWTARLVGFPLFDRLENITYDMRVRLASRSHPPAATNLGCVFIGDNSIVALNNGSLGFRYGLYWPRHLHGRACRELAAQGAKAVAFDILFSDPRPDHRPVPVSTVQYPGVLDFYTRLGTTPVTYDDAGERMALVESDEYFAWQLQRSGTAILAADRDVLPLPLFATNAMTVADISAGRDADGVLRRARAFGTYTNWHPAFRQVEADPDYGISLKNARVEPGRIILPRSNGEEIVVPVDDNLFFDLADFGGDDLPPGVPPRARAFTVERVWHMGVVLAARELNLDLANAGIDLPRGRIVLRGPGVERVIPVDARGSFPINWEITPDDPRLTTQAIEDLLVQDQVRTGVRSGEVTNTWAGKLVVIGSNATGNDLTDRGATPLDPDALLVGKHWNVASSIITGRFVRQSSPGTDLLLIALLGAASAVLTWKLRVLVASATVLLLWIGYTVLGAVLYVEHRYWLPLALPLLGALLLTHIAVVTWRVVFEQAEQRRIKSIFSTVVSPKIMAELLKAEKLSLGGARREITVMFADVRGFTELTDTSQELAAAFAREQGLTGTAAEACFDEQARETLATVNLYLGVVADTILRHDATLDKFIGDCVMAFWGAPVPSRGHAAACVRAVIEAQRAVHTLNLRREEQNRSRELENRARVSAGLQSRPLLPILLLGSGINTGMATAGLMGSETHAGVRQGNYTVFGRDVNLASRLESLSGRGRILISEATHAQLRRDDPALAATCIALPPEHVKGIRSAVNIFEVPWQPPAQGAQP